MPDQQSVLPAAPAQPTTRDRSHPSAGDTPSAGRRLVEGRIGFIGLGRMGVAMATNLVQSGCKVNAFVRR